MKKSDCFSRGFRNFLKAIEKRKKERPKSQGGKDVYKRTSGK